MILALDVGNSRIKVGLFELDQLVGYTSLQVAEVDKATLLQAVQGLLRVESSSDTTIEAIGVSCVVPALESLISTTMNEFSKVPTVWVESTLETKVRVGYRDPKELGPDRLANAEAAFRSYGGGCIVVDLGTAITFDVIDPTGELIGGAIFLGREPARTRLQESTTRIDMGELPVHPPEIGRTTTECIAVGLTHGYVALIEGLIERFRKSLEALNKPTSTSVVLTGGDSQELGWYSTEVDHSDPFLTLKGVNDLVRLNLGFEAPQGARSPLL